jgi:flavin reductase (DIM6/NTAB) family NADH-FMN oxidoreductase RutF
MVTLSMDQLTAQEAQQYLQAAIVPRPICFASTQDAQGNVNLSPFSFFNLFSIQPPICVFSPSRRVRDNTTKHTLDNLYEVPECVINLVNYAMVQQMSLSSCEYPKGVNEFIKAGFTPIPSETVAPPRVAESPIQLECSVQQIIPLGDQGGAGNLVVAEIKRMHISESVLNAQQKIDPVLLDLVARLGEDGYARITASNIFRVEKPNTKLGIGINQLPEYIAQHPELSGNEKAQLANVHALPAFFQQHAVRILTAEQIQSIKIALANNEVALAWTLIENSVSHQ